VKLLVIDALSQLFLLATGSAKEKLIDRSRGIAEISALLHSLARRHGIAILILNETSDVFEQRPSGGSAHHHNSDMTYREQAQWFNQAHSLPGESRKETRLGLPWANQVNVRLLLSRTERHRLLDTSSGQQPPW
jgi:DNA repair protein RAD57